MLGLKNKQKKIKEVYYVLWKDSIQHVRAPI